MSISMVPMPDLSLMGGVTATGEISKCNVHLLLHRLFIPSARIATQSSLAHNGAALHLPGCYYRSPSTKPLANQPQGRLLELSFVAAQARVQSSVRSLPALLAAFTAVWMSFMHFTFVASCTAIAECELQFTATLPPSNPSSPYYRYDRYQDHHKQLARQGPQAFV